MQTDVLVIGGGLAGLAAAYEAANRGLKVIIADESWSLGGQLRQQTQILNDLPDQFRNQRGFELASELTQRITLLNVDRLTDHTFIGMYSDDCFGFSNAERVISVQAKTAVIATGAAENPIAFPGWTLPGIMTVGAAQIMINRERVCPGKNALVVGSSDFALEVVRQMQGVGIHIAGIVTESQRQLSVELQPSNIPVFKDSMVALAKGKGRVEQVTVCSKYDPSLSIDFAVDLVCLDGGRHPILEPFTVLGCALGYEVKLGGWVPNYTNQLQTSVEGIYVAGNGAGITSQAGVLLTGMIAGIEAAQRLGCYIEEDRTTVANLWENLQQVEEKEVWEARRTHMAQFMEGTQVVTTNGGRNHG